MSGLGELHCSVVAELAVTAAFVLEWGGGEGGRGGGGGFGGLGNGVALRLQTYWEKGTEGG